MLAVTGAGVSAPSGLATFRGDDPGAVWREDDLAIATAAWFRRDPAGQWRWYLERFDRVLDAEPNPAHHALAALERWAERRGGRLLVVTQNVDPLHERAGQRDLIKVHGTADRFRCSRTGCRLGAPAGSIPRAEVDLAAFRAAPTAANVPACPACGAPLRAHALFFDEYYHGHRDYRWERVQEAATRSELVLFVGTSFSVGVTELLVDSALRRGAAVFSVDPNDSGAPEEVAHIPAPAEELLPAVAARLPASA